MLLRRRRHAGTAPHRTAPQHQLSPGGEFRSVGPAGSVTATTEVIFAFIEAPVTAGTSGPWAPNGTASPFRKAQRIMSLLSQCDSADPR
jgi:hypothetical protein